MIVLMKEKPREAQVQAVIRAATDWGLDVHRSSGVHRVVLGLVGDLSLARPRRLERMPGVDRVILISEPPPFFADDARKTRPMAPLSVGIVGLGLIGASWAKALRRYAPEHRIVADDRRLNHADIVILAMPVLAIAAFLKKHRRDFRSGTLITDVGSTKRAICAAARALPFGVTFIGGHPLAGRPGGGAAQADADLFVERNYVLTPEKGAPRKALSLLSALVRRVGARVVLATPEEHDRALAVTSHLPQLLSTALALEGASLAKRSPAAKALMGPAFRDMTRRAESSYEMWRDIALTNKDFIPKAIDSYLATLRKLRKTAPRAAFGKEFAKARAFRKNLD